ncbi:synaptotagmin-15-like isoform X2 [Mizuhopecten yessoensis]|uniref:Synaptotagmin-15 n=1 Tax=Mizuhopecten yessoensis TaxID=6573 RepID=A0A210QKZ2_MIZYE|nr:synaptotagmin-15-like isoform X2 [Mizuhopecten yessoensis]OWF49404.1 Synaptotagmin-15 [Mizuhopecten yessoensis]
MNDETLGVIIGGVTGGVVLISFIIITLVVCRRWKQKRKSWDYDWENSDKAQITKSAPISRSTSPNTTKRKSCPDTTPFKGVMVRSMTTDGIPDFSLPPERVQPCITPKRSQSMAPIQSNLLGDIQPDLYRSYGGCDDDDFHLPPSEHGRLWLSVIYDAVVEQLHVTLVKVKELIGRGRENSGRDPFVKIFLLPDERNCRISKVRKKTLTPVYNEKFVFEVSPKDIDESILRFSVYDVDKRRVRHSLGHVLLALRDLDITKGDTIWKDLEQSHQLSGVPGELCFSLNYLPNMDKLKVLILSARKLRQLCFDKDSGTYVRINMMHGRKLHKVKRTATYRATTDPTFNESFSFSLVGKVLDSCSFEICVMTSSRSPRSHDDVYGKVVVGSFMFSRGNELLHWQQMMSQPRTPVQRWHTLTGNGNGH